MSPAMGVHASPISVAARQEESSKLGSCQSPAAMPSATLKVCASLLTTTWRPSVSSMSPRRMIPALLTWFVASIARTLRPCWRPLPSTIELRE